MPDYRVIDGLWLDREIRNAEVLREHAQSTGKPIAIAAAGVRLESLKEIRRISQPALAAEEGAIRLSIAEAPRAPAAEEE